MRRLLATIAIASVACGGKLAPLGDGTVDGGSPDDAADATAPADADPDADSLDGGRAPVPTCSAQLSSCVQDDAGVWTGAAVVNCDPILRRGPLTFLLERQIGSRFQTIQALVVDKPGFGWTFVDRTGPPVELTYHVCIVDPLGTRCGSAFTSYGPPDCVCIALDCTMVRSCNTTVGDGCGHEVTCGACPDGTPCNPVNNSCCPPGFESDFFGGCECAPPFPCPRNTYWNTTTCNCESSRAPIEDIAGIAPVVSSPPPAHPH